MSLEISATAQLIIEAGYTSGWATHGEELVLWEHDADPPAPLTRPKATDETPSAD
jgi:hypothetical protein